MNNPMWTCCRSLTYNCNRCNVIFRTQRELVTHLLQHHISYQCACCDYTSNKYGSLGQHSRQKHGKDNFLVHCPICHFMQNDLKEIEYHLLTSHICPKFIYYCIYCDFKPTNEADILQHLSSKHSSKLTYCHCSIDPAFIQIESIFYSNNCSYCNYKCNNFESLQEHFKDSHWAVTFNEESGNDSDEGELCCRMCESNIVYDDEQEMEEHLRSDKTSINCKYCTLFLNKVRHTNVKKEKISDKLTTCKRNKIVKSI